MALVVLLILALFGIALLLGAAAYESVVMAPNYAHEIPTSVDTARAFLRARTPAHYFRVISPITQLFLLASIVVGWGNQSTRYSAGAVLLLLILSISSLSCFTIPDSRFCSRIRGPWKQSACSARLANGPKATWYEWPCWLQRFWVPSMR